jgi:hypothetical protein
VDQQRVTLREHLGGFGMPLDNVVMEVHPPKTMKLYIMAGSDAPPRLDVCCFPVRGPYFEVLDKLVAVTSTSEWPSILPRGSAEVHFTAIQGAVGTYTSLKLPAVPAQENHVLVLHVVMALF